MPRKRKDSNALTDLELAIMHVIRDRKALLEEAAARGER